MAVRQRMVDLLTNVDLGLATQVALGIAVPPPAGDGAVAAANARLQQAWAQYGVTARRARRAPSRWSGRRS